MFIYMVNRSLLKVYNFRTFKSHLGAMFQNRFDVFRKMINEKLTATNIIALWIEFRKQVQRFINQEQVKKNLLLKINLYDINASEYVQITSHLFVNQSIISRLWWTCRS